MTGDRHPITLPPGVQHGWKAAYGLGCRCPDCTAANTAGQRRRRRRRGVQPRPEPRPYVCGERRTYTNGCRCEACTLAEKVYRARYRYEKARAMP